MAWQQFVMQLDALPPETVEEIFQRHGAHSVTLSDAGDSPLLEPAPGETPLWPETQISGLFSHSANLGALRDELLRRCKLRALPAHRIEVLPERDWVTEWRRGSRPLQFGRRLWVGPDDFEAPDDAAVVLRLDPGLAFGSGTHATTALCLEWLDGLELQGLRVLDYGCGSGILSLAALKLGAWAACAVDIDPQAITATRANARRNGVTDRLTALRHGAEPAGPFDVVIANILAGPLTELAPALCACLNSGSKLALSGILDAQADAVMQAYRPWIEFQPVVTQAGWARLTGVRN